MTTLTPKTSLQNGGTTYTGAANRPINLKVQDIVSVKDFGAVGDGIADDTTAIQNCVDYAIYYAQCGVYMPAGNYKISKTIQLGYGAVGGIAALPFSGLTVQGAGFKFKTESQNGFSGTGIIPTFSNAPVFNVQCCRHTCIKGIGMIGLYYNYVGNNGLGNLDPAFSDIAASAWVDSSLAANAFSRYAPYAAITVDAYSGAARGAPNQYPDVTYPAFLGAQTQYNKTGISSEVILEDLYIGGFATAVVFKPNGTDSQGEFLKMHRCLIECCQYAVSLGHTQARIFDINSCQISNVHTALVTNVHGLQNGMPCFSVRATEFDRLINVINISTAALGGPTMFDGCYGEIVYALGYFGSGAIITCSLNMIGCTFNYYKQSTAGAPQALLADPGVNSVVNIQGCWFGSFIGNLIFDVPNGNFTFINNSLYLDAWGPFHLVGGIVQPYNIYPTKSYGLVQTRTYGYFKGSYQYTSYSLATGDLEPSPTTLYNRSYSGRGTPLYRFSDVIYSGDSLTSGARDPGILNPLNTYDALLNGPSDFTFSMSGRTATITMTTTFTADQCNVQGMNPGDLINYVTPAGKTYTFYIKARTTNVITAMLQNGFDGSGNALVALTNTATLYFFVTRYYYCANFQLGTFTNASPNITAVGNSSAVYNFEGQVGDAFMADAITDSFAAVTDTRITVINSGTRVITMNGNATKTETKRLPILIQQAPANV